MARSLYEYKANSKVAVWWKISLITMKSCYKNVYWCNKLTVVVGLFIFACLLHTFLALRLTTVSLDPLNIPMKQFLMELVLKCLYHHSLINDHHAKSSLQIISLRLLNLNSFVSPPNSFVHSVKFCRNSWKLDDFG